MKLTAEQIEIIDQAWVDLDERFFDMAGRLQEESAGSYKFECFRTSVKVADAYKINQYLVYANLRNRVCTPYDYEIREDYNMCMAAFKLGAEMITDRLLK